MINPVLFGMAASTAVESVEAEGAVAGARARASRATKEVQHIEERLDRLVLVNMALWSLIQEKTQLTEEDLMGRVQQIDLADGQLDGKACKPIAKCPDCGRTMSPRHKRCLYCGAERLDYTAFDSAR